MNLIELATQNEVVRDAYKINGRVSRAYLQRKYMISFCTADDLAMHLEKILNDKPEKACTKTT